MADVFHARHYHDLNGALLEALAHFFACNVVLGAIAWRTLESGTPTPAIAPPD
jgi:hypothetical protein